MSAGCVLPDLVRTSSAPPAACWKPATPSLSSSRMPCRSTWSSTIRAMSRSSGARSWSSISTRVTSNPRCTRFSAVSRPMKPPPMTTARVLGFTVWKPAYLSIPVRNSEPRSIHSRIARASGTVRTWKIPGRSIPGKGGRTDSAPGDSTSLSYDSLVTSPVSTSRSSMVLVSGRMRTASQLVRTSILNMKRKVSAVATSRLDSFSITPPTW